MRRVLLALGLALVAASPLAAAFSIYTPGRVAAEAYGWTAGFGGCFPEHPLACLVPQFGRDDVASFASQAGERYVVLTIVDALDRPLAAAWDLPAHGGAGGWFCEATSVLLPPGPVTVRVRVLGPTPPCDAVPLNGAIVADFH